MDALHRLEALGSSSERVLDRELDKARRGGAHDLAESRARDVAIHCRRAVELRCVEYVEGFQTELHCVALTERDGLQQREIGVDHPRPVKEPARRVAQMAEGGDRKATRV